MNNSKLALDSLSSLEESTTDVSPKLREREGELVSIIDALQKVQQSPDWSTLKTKVFDSLPLTLEKELKEEAKKDDPDTLKLNRLAGQLKWAEKYSDLSKLEAIFRVELTRLRTQLYGQKES